MELDFSTYSAPFYVQVQAAGKETLERAKSILAGIEGGMTKALRAAMTESTRYLRANAAKAVGEEYAISEAAVRAEKNVSVRYTFSGGVQAFVTFRGNKIPLYRYDGTSPAVPRRDTARRVKAIIGGQWRLVNPSLPVSAHQRRDTAPKLFRSAFVEVMSNGHAGIFARNGEETKSGGHAISEVMGKSVPQMLGSRKVAEKLTAEAMEKFEERLEQAVNRILNGGR